MRDLNYIAIEGPIGVGKTSLAKLLSKKMNARLILEKFEDNPFLSEFYDDPGRFAFQTQLFFLLQRYQQQQDIRQVDMFHNIIISDYMFIKDRLFASLNLDEKEMNLYDSIANMMERTIINPELIIYLEADTSTLMKNIEKRGRNFENNISFDYINALNDIYTEYFFRYNDTPLVIINTNNIDFVNNADDLDQVIDYINQPVSGTKFFNPSASI